MVGWEFLYKHRTEVLFLSAYVDDIKLAGKKDAVHRMSKRLGEVLGPEEPLPLDKNVYLGCGQQNVVPPDILLSDQQNLYKTLLADDVHHAGDLG